MLKRSKVNISIFLFFLISLFVFSSCQKSKGGYALQIEAIEDVGTIYFQAKPLELIDHPVFKKNKDLQRYMNIEKIGEKLTPEQKEILKKVSNVSGLYSALNGKEIAMILVEGDFKTIKWEDILKENFKRSELKGLPENALYYVPNEKDKPSLMIFENHIYVAEEQQILDAYKKLSSSTWTDTLKKELETDFVIDSLKSPLLLLSYLPPKKRLKEIDEKIKKEMNDIPINLSLKSFERLSYGLGIDQEDLSYITTIQFSDPQDIKDVKGILIGFKSLYRLLARNIEPIVQTLDKTEISSNETMVYMKGSVNPDEMDKMVQFTKKEVSSYQKKQFSKFMDKPKEDYNAKQKRIQDLSNKLSSEIMDVLVQGDYEKFEPLLAEKLKPSFGKVEFEAAKKSIKELGEFKSIKVNYPYAFDEDGKEVISASPEIIFIKDGMEEKRNGSMKFIEENGKYKLLSMFIY